MSLEQYIISQEDVKVLGTGFVQYSSVFWWDSPENVLLFTDKEMFNDKKIIVHDNRIYILDDTKEPNKTSTAWTYHTLVPIFEDGSFQLENNKYNNFPEFEVIIKAMNDGKILKNKGVLYAHQQAGTHTIRKLCELQHEYRLISGN